MSLISLQGKTNFSRRGSGNTRAHTDVGRIAGGGRGTHPLHPHLDAEF